MPLESYKKKHLTFLLLIAFTLFSTPLIAGDESPADDAVEITLTEPQTPQLQEASNDPEELYIDEGEFANLPVVRPQEPSHVSTALNAGEAPVADAFKPMNPVEKEKAEELLKKVIKSFEKISFSLESIALVLNHNQLRIKDKTPMVEEILKLRTLTQMIVSSAITEVTPEKITHLITLAQQLIDHIRYLLTTDLVTFISFDTKMAPLARSPLEKPTVQTIEQLEASLQKATIVLGKLETEAVNVGLNSFNILFRRLEKLNDDYKIVNKCLWGLGGAAAVTGLIFILEPSYLKKIGGVFDKALNRIGLKPNSVQSDTALQLNENNTFGASTFDSDILKNLNWQGNTPPATGSIQNNQAFAPVEQKYEDTASYGYATRGLLYIKSLTGDALSPKMLMEQMGGLGKTVGEGTRLQNLVTRTVPIVVLGVPPISIFALLQPTLKEAGTNCLDWVRTKRSQCASFLRGGPIKKSLSKFERESKCTFDDIIGNEHAKMIGSRLVEYIVDPEPFDRAGTAPGNELLTGLTRSGKTFFADAVYGETKRRLELKGDHTKLNYYMLDAAQLKEWGIEYVFMYAREHAPCILFIDEIDKGRFQNDGDAGSLCKLQVAMSELNTDKKNKVIVIAATNRPDNLDPSLRAHGRFGDIIPFTYPSKENRQEYFTRELTKRAAIIDAYYIEQLAYETEGANYDLLQAIIVTAFQKAKIKGVSLSEIELAEALDEQFHKMIFDEKTLPDKELLLVAAHQIAHAFARIVLNPSLQLTKATIRPVVHTIEEVSVIGEALSGAKKQSQEVINYGAVFTAHRSNAFKFDTYQDLISELKICLAGHVAEKLLLGGTSFDYHTHDTEKAFDLAKRLAFHGMQEKNMPKAVKEQKLVEAYELVQKYEQEVTELLTKHKQELTVLTNILFEEKTLSCDAIIAILKELKRQDKDISTPIEAHDNPASTDDMPIGIEDTELAIVSSETNDNVNKDLA